MNGWHIEPTEYPTVYGTEAVEVRYDDGNRDALLDTLRPSTTVTGRRYWHDGRHPWTWHETLEAAIDACKAEWQPLIDGNLAEGRAPLFQPAHLITRREFGRQS